MNKNQMLLPFAEREYVDMPRACRILGASWTAVVGMAASGYLRLVDYRRNGHKRVHYATLVEHCNRLREEYAIPDRRPALACELLRYRDEDILPFALRDTIGIADAAPMLGYLAKWTATRLCEEGRFESYRLHPCAPWRISLSSLRLYIHGAVTGEPPHTFEDKLSERTKLTTL